MLSTLYMEKAVASCSSPSERAEVHSFSRVTSRLLLLKLWMVRRTSRTSGSEMSESTSSGEISSIRAPLMRSMMSFCFRPAFSAGELG